MRRHSDFFRRPTQRRTNERPNTILHRKEFNVRGRTIEREKPREKQLSSEQASGHTQVIYSADPRGLRKISSPKKIIFEMRTTWLNEKVGNFLLKYHQIYFLEI